MKKLIAAALVTTLLALPALAGAYMEVNGRVIRVTAMGGETTGYALKILNGTLTINGTQYAQIEIDPRGRDMKPYLFRFCYVTGGLEYRTGVERGTYPVIGVETITKRSK
jgi:hypothetical protein